MSHPFFIHKEDVIDWLDANSISFYSIVDNPEYRGIDNEGVSAYLVDTQKDVALCHQVMSHIPVQFRSVGGSFLVSSNRLKSLKGGPQCVAHHFECKNNLLTNLDYCPTFVGKNFDCRKNEITSLKGVPKTIKGSFSCNINQLTTLEHCPEEIGEEFIFSRNNIDTLEFFPRKVGSKVIGYSNKISQINMFSRFDDFWRVHEFHKTVKYEREMLGVELLDNSTPTKSQKI